MALQSSDNIGISRAGTLYKIAASDILDYIQGQIGTAQYIAATIAARNALGNLSYGDRIFVTDATADGTVTAGWAIYIYISAGVFTKIAESEMLDILAGANLAYTASATQGVVTSDTGSDATIPAVSGTDAGLAIPAHKVKLDHLTVTAATDLDAIRTASHAAVTLAGTAATNPIALSGQVLSFDIASLTTAP